MRPTCSMHISGRASLQLSAITITTFSLYAGCWTSRVDLQQVATQRTELPDSLSLYHFAKSFPLRKVKRLTKYQRSQRRGALGPPSTSAHWSAWRQSQQPHSSRI